jgi:diacylglycerol kinase family enzyme
MLAAAVTVLLNRSAGSGTDADSIAASFRAAGREAQVITLDGKQDPTELAARYASPGAAVVAAGGDGTVSSVAAGVVGTGAVLGVLPVGTLNHFAKDLGIPVDLDGAIDTIVNGRIGAIDVGEVNGRIFLNACSIGIYPSVVQIREALRSQGYRKWHAMALAIYRVLRHYRGVHVRMAAVQGRVTQWRTPFLFVGNNEYTLEGFQLGGRTTLERGQLVAYLAPRARTRDLPMLLARALIGRARQSGAFEIIPATEFWIDTRHAGPSVALDGELIALRPPLHFQVRPRALHVLLPIPVS